MCLVLIRNVLDLFLLFCFFFLKIFIFIMPVQYVSGNIFIAKRCLEVSDGNE